MIKINSITNFTNFFQKNNTNTDVKIWLDVYEDFYSILSNVILHNNLNLQYGIYITPDFPTLNNDNFFKNNISESLLDSLIDVYNDNNDIFNKGWYLIVKENLSYPNDYLILYYRQLLKHLKSLIDQNIFKFNLEDEIEINDFLQTYIISLLLYNNSIIDQLDYLRNIGYGQLGMWSIYDDESKNIVINNAYSTQMYYIYNQDYLDKKYLKENNISSPIKNYKKLFSSILDKFNNSSNDKNFSKNMSYDEILRYYLFEVANNYINDNKLLEDNEYDFVLNAYNHFTNDNTKEETFYYSSNISLKNIENSETINNIELTADPLKLF